jgi:hypothetical protein
MSSSRSPRTIKGSSGALTLTAMPRSLATVCKVSMTCRMIACSSTGVSGRMCSFNSMRESESKSSISRAMRRACPSMMPRKRSRAEGSSRAGPCSVSMKPDNAASGVRSSWLALATKSTRICSTRRYGVRSRKVSSKRGVRAFPADSAVGVTCTSYQRSTGFACENSACCGLPVATAA